MAALVAAALAGIGDPPARLSAILADRYRNIGVVIVAAALALASVSAAAVAAGILLAPLLTPEAKLLMLEHAFGDLGCLRVEFKTDARNERSRAALAALPAQFEGVFRKHMLVRGGERRDSAYYSIIDDEWPGVRENLQRRLEATRREAG